MPRPGCAPGARPARRPPRRPCAWRCAPGRSGTRRPCRRRRCSSHASRCGSRRRCARARAVAFPDRPIAERAGGSACRLRRGAPRRCVGSIARKSCLSVRRASSAICPATSHPVGPPPTTAKVSHRPALRLGGRRLGQLERREDPPPQVEGVVDRLHRRASARRARRVRSTTSSIRWRRSGCRRGTCTAFPAAGRRRRSASRDRSR